MQIEAAGRETPPCRSQYNILAVIHHGTNPIDWRIAMRACLVLVASLVMTTASDAQDPAAADKAARDVVEKFGKAFKAGDADACMKLVAAPFNLDGRELLKDREALKTFIEKACARQKTRPIDKLEIEFVKTLAELEKDRKAPSRGVTFAEVLDRNKDRMVLARAITGERKEGVLFGVRLDKDGAKIVGLFD
jgi:phage terminase large subunit GpA-like protein